MVESLTAAQREGIRRGDQKPIMYVEIEHSGGSPAIWKAVSGTKRIENLPNLVSKITPREGKYDEGKRRTTQGKMTVTFVANPNSEGPFFLSLLIRDFVIKNAKVIIKEGRPGWLIADYMNFWVGVIDNADISPDGTEHFLHCVDVKGMLERNDALIGSWQALGPLDILEDLHIKSDVPTALYDAATFDQEAFSDVSHHALTRSGSDENIPYASWFRKEITTPVNAMKAAEDVLRLSNGGLFQKTTGVSFFKQLDRNEASVRSIGPTDIIGLPRQMGTYNNFVNRSIMQLGGNPAESRSPMGGSLGSGEFADGVQFAANDVSSQTSTAYPGEPEYIQPEVYKSQWLNQRVGPVPGESFSGSLPTLSHKVPGGVARHGFAGAALPSASRVKNGTVPTIRRLNSGLGRFGYLMAVWESGTLQLVFEVFRAVALSLDWADGSDTDEYGEVWPLHATYTFDQRGLFGSTGTAANLSIPSIALYDVTIPQAYTTERIDQFSAGVPDFEISLNISHRDLEEGDVIDVTHPIFAATTKAGLTSTTTWRIVGRKEDPYSQEPVKLSLRWLRTVSVPVKTITYNGTIQIFTNVTRSVQDTDVRQKHVQFVGDFAETSGSGSLVVTIGGGSLAGLITDSVTAFPDTTLTLEASKDVYIYAGILDRTLREYDVAPAGPQPTPAVDEVPLWKFVTNGTGVTSVTWLGSFSPFVSGALEPYYDASFAKYVDAASDVYYKGI